jgi:hypothetical protein
MAKDKFVRVLTASAALGAACNDLICLSAEAADQAVEAGSADDSKAALAYAKALPQNSPEIMDARAEAKKIAAEAAAEAAQAAADAEAAQAAADAEAAQAAADAKPAQKS